MRRFRPHKTLKLVGHLRGGFIPPTPRWKHEELSHDLQDRWKTLHRHCADHWSRLRLGRLVHRLTHDDYGVRESALAELELATHLIRAGVRVKFLPESQARTADLECCCGKDRFFVEVTAMVGSGERRRFPLRGLIADEEAGYEEDCGTILVHRILARIQQKAKQLADYCDPVILSISIPRADFETRSGRPVEIRPNLKALAASVTLVLTKLRHLSAVMIGLWDVEPLPSRGAIRLVNVKSIQRPKHQRVHPRVRLLIKNPHATAPLTAQQDESFNQIL